MKLVSGHPEKTHSGNLMGTNDKKKPYNTPNFFILGAAKSGTTSLYFYLKQHPSIFLSPVKEPTFFCEDFQVVKNPITYFELFELVKNEKIIGEASHGYMSDPKVHKVLKALFPNAKFLVILRNPADRAYSLYQHMRRYDLEPISSFEKALIEEEKRSISEHFKKNNKQYFHNYLYFRSGLYGAQLEKYFSLFDRSQFHITTLDDLESDFTGTLLKIWKFLDVDPTFKASQEIHNKGFMYKSLFLEKLLDLRIFNNRISNKIGIKAKLKALNLTSPEKIKTETRKKLMERYQSDQNLLFQLTGIRLN